MSSILSCLQNLLSAAENKISNHLKLEQEIVEELSTKLIIEPQEKPIVLLIGGFQGSGKSSLIDRITKATKINVISTDVIRQSLFNRGIKVSSEFSQSVSRVYEILVKQTLMTHANVVIDANAHSKRIQEMNKFLVECSSEHKMMTIFLNASEKVLRDRLTRRNPVSGHYQGTEKDLEASLISSKINLEDYDLIIDTDTANKDEVYQLAKYFLSPYLRFNCLDFNKGITNLRNQSCLFQERSSVR